VQNIVIRHLFCKDINLKYIYLLTIQCIIRFIELLTFIVVLATIFIVNKEMAHGVISGKYFWFYFSMGLCSFVSTGLVVFNRNKLQVNLLDGLVALFGLTSLLFVNFIHFSDAVTKQILLVLVIMLYFFFILPLKGNKNIIYWLTVCFIFTGLVEAVWGLRQLWGFEISQHYLFRLTGSFFNPGPYACYLAVVLPMAFYYTLKYQICFQVRFRFCNMPIYLLWGISVLTVIASVFILPASMSRASWMAATGGCGLVLIYFFSKNRKVKNFIVHNKKKSILIASIIILSIASGGYSVYYLKKDSADGRAFIWKNTLELIRQNPVGVGLGNYSGSYGHIQAAYFESGTGTEDEERVAESPEYAFNEYLQLFAEQGIVVFLLFIGIVGYSLYIGIKRKRIAATASLLALLIAASVSYPFNVLPFLIILVFLLALINRQEKGIVIPKSVSVMLAVCSFFIVALCLYNRYPTYYAYKKWEKVNLQYQYRDYKEAVNEYSELYPLLSDQVKFLFEYAQSLSKTEQYTESNEVLKRAMQISCDPMLYNVMGKNYQAMKQYTEAEQCFIKSSHIVPNRIYPYYLMTLMYMETGEMKKAKDAAQIVLTKEPKVQSTAVKEMREEVSKIIN